MSIGRIAACAVGIVSAGFCRAAVEPGEHGAPQAGGCAHVDDADPWYHVSYGGQQGYIQGPYVEVVSAGSLTPATAAATATATATAATATPTASTGSVTAVPTTTVITGSGEYARLLLSSTNLYGSPNGAVTAVWSGVGSTLPVVGSQTMAAGVSWYPVNYQGSTLYVRGDAIQLTTAEGGAPSTTASTTATATTTSSTATGLGYVVTIRGDVNLRLQPSGSVITQVRRKTVSVILAEPVTVDNYDWYYVQVPTETGTLNGYLRGDCVSRCDASGNILDGEATQAPAQTATPSPVPTGGYGYVRTIANSVNLRDAPAGKTIEQIPINTVLAMTGPAVVSGRYTWYPVTAASGHSGYLRGDCVVATDGGGTVISATPTPTVAVTATAAATSTDHVVYGYIQVTKSSTNVRVEPAGNAFTQVARGTVWPIVGLTVTGSGYSWFNVSVNGRSAYIRGDCAVQLTDEQVAAYLAGQGIPVVTATPAPTATATPVPVSVVQTILTGVWLRKAASKDSQAMAQVSINTVLTYTGTKTVGGKTWYNVIYSGQSLWVLGTCVKTLTADEYAAYIAEHPTATAEPVITATPAPSGYVKTIKGGVNVRATADGKSILGQVARNLVLVYTAKTTVGKYEWYRVTTSYGVGWVRGDCVTECGADGTMATATPASTASTTTVTATATSGTGTVVGSSQIEASYSILKVGSTGDAVTRLVQALINQGYYTGSVTSTYTTAVEAAVKAFQAAKGLTVDGIAGSATQHNLFGTVPVGTADGSDMRMVIYPAEKIDWFTGGIQELWPRGMNVKVYDVKTGIVWWAHRWAGAYHADIEPLTATDTARLCAIYGVSSPQEIIKKDLWQRRPSLITIGNRTFACSLYGVPHGTGEISNNNFPGQICMHFTNSKTHNGKSVNSYHTAAIQYAWENAPNGHK